MKKSIWKRLGYMVNNLDDNELMFFNEVIDVMYAHFKSM